MNYDVFHIYKFPKYESSSGEIKYLYVILLLQNSTLLDLANEWQKCCELFDKNHYCGTCFTLRFIETKH